MIKDFYYIRINSLIDYKTKKNLSRRFKLFYFTFNMFQKTGTAYNKRLI